MKEKTNKDKKLIHAIIFLIACLAIFGSVKIHDCIVNLHSKPVTENIPVSRREQAEKTPQTSEDLKHSDKPEKTTSEKKYYTIDEIIVPDKMANRDYYNYSDSELKLINEAREYWVGRIKVQQDFILKTVQKYINPGDTVVDLGCGSGWYTFFFSQLVGKNGRVYASDSNVTAYLAIGLQKKGMQKKYPGEAFSNITPMLNDENDVCQEKESVNTIVLSDVHILHVNMNETVVGKDGSKHNVELQKIKDSGLQKQQNDLCILIGKNQGIFIKSIYDSLKKDGYFIVIEDVTDQPQKLQKKLVAKLLESNGFKLVEDASRQEYQLLILKNNQFIVYDFWICIMAPVWRFIEPDIENSFCCHKYTPTSKTVQISDPTIKPDPWTYHCLLS